MKAISTVITSILMLMIVVGLGGTAYLFILGTFTSKTATTFELIDEVNGTVTIRNSGTETIKSFTSVKIDGSDAVYVVNPSVEDSSLVVYWKMDEFSWANDCSTATVIDYSGNGNNGKSCPPNSGPTGGITGKFGNAGGFDGINDYVDAGNINDANTNGDLTILSWIKIDETGKDQPIAWKTYAFQFRYDSSNRLNFRIGNGQNWVGSDDVVSSPSLLTVGQWHHVVARYENSATRRTIYLDGVQVAQDTSAGSGGTNTNIITIGAGNGFIHGSLDDIKMYKRAFSAEEINDHYNKPSQIPQINPGELGIIKIYNQLSKGTHTLRLCTSNMCNAAVLTII